MNQVLQKKLEPKSFDDKKLDINMSLPQLYCSSSQFINEFNKNLSKRRYRLYSLNTEPELLKKDELKLSTNSLESFATPLKRCLPQMIDNYKSSPLVSKNSSDLLHTKKQWKNIS